MKRNKKKGTNDLRYQKLQKVIQIKLSHRSDRAINPQGYEIQYKGFVKIIEQEYASKYLEMLNIEPSNANIKMLLKQYPLKKCDIIPFWNENDGNNPDYIQIVPHKYKEKNVEQKPVIKKEEIKQKQEENINYKIYKEQQGDEIMRFELNYNIESIRDRYIYPFNQTKQKKDNQAMINQHISQFCNKNEIYFLPKLQTDQSLIYEQIKFQFPFSKIRLSDDIIQEISATIKVQPNEILEYLKNFVQQFPKNMIPYENKNETVLKISEKDVNETLKIIHSEPMSTFIGLFSHMSYNVVLGQINPIQIDPLIKKQIFVNMMEQILILQQNCQCSDKIWKFLVFPIILLTLKMQLENIFQNQYKKLFQNPDIGQLLMDKIWYLQDNVFDPTMLEGRFIFLEKDQRYTDQKKIIERNQLQKRIYSLSSQIEMLLPNPQESHARVLLLKNRQYFEKNGPIKESLNNTQHNFQEIKKLTKKLDQNQMKVINDSFNQKNYQIMKNKLQLEK